VFIGLYKYSLGATEEYLFGTGDIANNVCLESFIDLGPFGPFVYGVVFAILFFAIDWLMAWMAARNRYLTVMVVGSLIEPLVSPEADLMAYFSLLRNILTFCALVGLVTLAIGRMPATGTARPTIGRPRFAGFPGQASPAVR
jgi:hypothetical protein